jgi:hypothetical protein
MWMDGRGGKRERKGREEGELGGEREEGKRSEGREG